MESFSGRKKKEKKKKHSLSAYFPKEYTISSLFFDLDTNPRNLLLWSE